MKTETKEDYLLTDQKLKNKELLPYLKRSNPHMATLYSTRFYLRYQVEEYAFSKKWSSAEALDEEFTRREEEKNKRKKEKFKSKLQELKKRTRTEAYRRKRAEKGGGTLMIQLIGGKHTHV